MKMALIYPPHTHKIFNENLFTVDSEFGKFPYISYGYIAAIAKNMGGVNVKIFDKDIGPELLSEVINYNPDLMTFAAHSAQTFREVVKCADYLKNATQIPTLVGGYEANYYPKEIMEHLSFDYLCSGQIFTFFEKFIHAFQLKKNYDQVPNLFYRSHGDLLLGTNKGNNKVTTETNLPFHKWPIPDRSIFDNEKYYSFVSQKKNFTIALSSLGCPYQCIFCCMSSSGYQTRTSEQVVEEIEICNKVHNINEIDFFDPLMFYNVKRISDICDRIYEKKINIFWSARTRLDSLTMNASNSNLPNEKFIEKLALSGCKRLFVGIESGSDLILKNIKKNLKVNDLKTTKRILDCLKSHGIRPLGFFMIGNPGETKSTVKETITFAKKLPLDYAQFSMTILKPHTELEKKFIETNHFDYWKEYIRGNVDEKILPSPWTSLSRRDIEKFTKLAYLIFYLRPTIIFKSILNIKSYKELLRYIKVFVKMLLYSK
ncbi:MAG: B12-binding domain-containing radical SAM protein [Oligoflexia bacterium]|nr:B12-binding domain-containing radical SAM protein [Oligoflexia bacterium]